MAKSNERLSFSRQDVRKATKFVEGDYNGINPRSFYRKLKRSIEEIQDSNGFKYEAKGDPQSDFEINSEEVGQKTGTVEGRLEANSDWTSVGHGVLKYKPYGPHGAVGIVVGISLLLIGLSGSPPLSIIGLALAGVGGYGYVQEEREEFPVINRDFIRTLINGEVSERTQQGEQGTRTDIFANMSVVYAGDVFLAVDASAAKDLDWTFRRELVNQTKRWRNDIVDTEQERVKVDDGFVWQLKGLADRNADEHEREIFDAQKPFVSQDSEFEYRRDYRSTLEDYLTPDMQEKVRTHESDLMEELEGLAQDVNVYVEREGFQHTNQVDGSSAQSQIGSGDGAGQ